MITYTCDKCKKVFSSHCLSSIDIYYKTGGSVVREVAMQDKHFCIDCIAVFKMDAQEIVDNFLKP